MMIVPKYWAESRLQGTVRGKQVTLLRFGWSDRGHDDAQAMADGRTREAMARLQLARLPPNAFRL